MSSEPRVHISPGLRKDRSFGRLARTSVLWGYLRSGIYALVAIPTTMVLARLLTPEDFGIVAAATFFAQLSSRLASGGTGSALVRVKELRPEHITTVFTVNVAMTALLVAALVAVAPLIASFYDSPEVGWVLPAVGVTFLFGALSSVQQALLRRDLRYREMATIGSLDLVVASSAAILFAAFGYGFWSLVIGEICGAFVTFVYGVKVVGWHVRFGFDRAAARELSSFAAGSYVRRLLEHLTRNVDNLVVARVLGVTSLGFYDKAFSLANRLYLRLTVVGPNVSFRIFSIIQDEPERFRAAYHKVITTSTLITYTAFAVLGTIAPNLIVVALGEQWGPSVVPFQVLCVSFALKTLNQYAVSASEARGWIWSQIWRQMIQVACIVAGVYIASAWGINGAAIAVTAAALVMFFLTQGMMRAATGLNWGDTLRPQAPALTVSAVLIAGLWGINVMLAARIPVVAVLLGQIVAAGIVLLTWAWRCPFAHVRVILHDTVNDLSPPLAGAIWADVADQQRFEKSRRTGSRDNAETHLAC